MNTMLGCRDVRTTIKCRYFRRRDLRIFEYKSDEMQSHVLFIKYIITCNINKGIKFRFICHYLLIYLIFILSATLAPANVMAQSDRSSVAALSYFPPNSRTVWGKLIKLISDKSGFAEVDDIANTLGINSWPNKRTDGDNTIYYFSNDKLSPFNAAIMIMNIDISGIKYKQSSINITWTSSPSAADCEPLIEFESKLKKLGWNAIGLTFQPRLNEEFLKDHAVIRVVPDGAYSTACLQSISILSSASK